MAKQEYSSTDAQPVVLYAPSSSGTHLVSPLLATSNGALLISSGLNIPSFDYVDFTNLSNIMIKSGGVNGVQVATINITGTTMTRT